MTFDDALEFVLAREGGFVCNPNDRGGATNKGITQSTYDMYRAKFLPPTRSVEEITDGEVRDIYQRFYWAVGHCDDLPDPVSIVHFDAAVNCGPYQAMKFLQDALGVEIDGEWGPKTEDAAKMCMSRLTAIHLIGIRAEFYIGLAQKDSAQEVFSKGWINRLVELRQFCGLDGPYKKEE